MRFELAYSVRQDSALSRKADLKDRSLLVTDLAEAWIAWTGTPFVFAVWAVRRTFFSQYPDAVFAAHRALKKSREWGFVHFDDVVRRSREKTELGEDLLRFYFSNLRYHLDEPAKKGMQLFLEYAAECGLLTKPVVLEEMSPALAGSSALLRSSKSVQTILEEALDGKRVSVDEGVKLYYEADLFELGVVANELNLRKNPESLFIETSFLTFHVGKVVIQKNLCYAMYGIIKDFCLALIVHLSASISNF